MTVTNQILADITVHTKYAKYVPSDNRRENWSELVTRNMNMHLKKYPEIALEIGNVYRNFVFTKKVLPSMRSLQFGGRPIEIAPNRIFNCAFMPVDSIYSFSEAMFLLLGGTGLGFSVQRHHIEQLPSIYQPKTRKRRFLIGDSIEGWADAIKVLMEAYFLHKCTPVFDYSDIRPKGAELVTSGGKAPGPQPLKDAIHNIIKILDAKAPGTQLTTLEAHDIMCLIADAVLAGGIRRAALISLFSMNDEELLACKSGNWWETHPYRARANNSAVVLRHKITKPEFMKLMTRVKLSGSGEPGVYFSNDKEWGTNPCCEIGLRSYQMCNLSTINASDLESQDDLNSRCAAASFIGTLQAGYTDFHYLRNIWKQNVEKDALIGVSMTGIGSGVVQKYNLIEAANVVVAENERIAALIGINPAARTTTVKPEGTASMVLGSSSGIHAWHNDFYIRRMRVAKNEAIYKYLAKEVPALVQDEFFSPTTSAVLEIPQAAPAGSLMRTESAETLLERVKEFNTDWVKPGHKDGQNTHNVSCTISVKDDEWAMLADWMWSNRNDFNGIACLPYDGGTYIQAPFEDITEEEFNSRVGHLHAVNLDDVHESEDETDLSGELACAGGLCEI
jgi:ribonucleoside-triphosphate reductase